MQSSTTRPFSLSPSSCSPRSTTPRRCPACGCIKHLDLPAIIINDGSTDDTPKVLTEFGSFTQLTHVVNRGKAAALQIGFAAARKSGSPMHSQIEISYGQHDPSQIPQILTLARQLPELCRSSAAATIASPGAPPKTASVEKSPI